MSPRTNDAPSPSVSVELATTRLVEMDRLTAAGVRLVPLSPAENGKKPSCLFKGRPPSPAQVRALTRRTHATTYGVLLGDLVVVDFDDHDPRPREVVRIRFGPSPVRVATARGEHWYYQRGPGPLPRFRIPGVDLKHGSAQFVLGPWSVRPDTGTVYEPITGVLGVMALPTFEERGADGDDDVVTTSAPVNSPHVPVGRCNAFLTERAVALARRCPARGELTTALLRERDRSCEAGPVDALMSDREVEGIAAWAWRRKSEGRLYRGRASEFQVRRDVMDVLLRERSGHATWALYCVLRSEHGHRPGRAFALNHEAMKGAALIAFGRPAFDEAVRRLQELGLLYTDGRYVPGHRARRYRLGTMQAGDADDSGHQQFQGHPREV